MYIEKYYRIMTEFNGFSNDVLNAVISLVLNKGNCVVN